MRKIISDLNPGSAAVGKCVRCIEVPDISFYKHQKSSKIIQLTFDEPVLNGLNYIQANVMRTQGGISGIHLSRREANGALTRLNAHLQGTGVDPIFPYHCFILVNRP